MTLVMYFYDVCHDGKSPKKIFFTQSLTPFPVKAHANEVNSK
jgi:hypothetical protein